MPTRYPETGYVKVLYDDEFQTIMREAGRRNSVPFRNLLYVLGFCGLRGSDAVRLRKRHFKPDLSLIRYKDHKTGVIQERPIPPFLRPVLRAWLLHLPLDGYAFPPARASCNEHIQLASLAHFFKDVRRRHGWTDWYHMRPHGLPLYRVSLHTLKGYCLYQIYRASGRDLSYALQYSGHRDVKHLLRYLRRYEFYERSDAVMKKAFKYAPRLEQAAA